MGARKSKKPQVKKPAVISPEIDIDRISRDYQTYEESDAFDGDPATVYRRAFVDGVRWAREQP